MRVVGAVLRPDHFCSERCEVDWIRSGIATLAVPRAVFGLRYNLVASMDRCGCEICAGKVAVMDEGTNRVQDWYDVLANRYCCVSVYGRTDQ